jgi:tartrate-resistant acid phosphatase type 5
MKAINPKVHVGVLIVITALITVSAAMWILPIRDTSPYKRAAAPPSRAGIIAFGDQGSGDFRQRRVAALVESTCRAMPDLAFIQTLGDNFYYRGVRSLHDPLWHDALESIYDTPCIAQTPFHALLGNHDEEGDPSVEIAYNEDHHSPVQWRMPAHFYASHAGITADGRTLVGLVVIDTNMALRDQIALIDRTFANPDDPVWRIVAGHHNVRTDSAKYHDNDRLRHALLPALKRNHVHFYLAGHSHNLQLIERSGEPVYVIAGGGGKRPRPVLSNTDNKALLARQSLGFVSMSFDAAGADIRFIATSGHFYSTLAKQQFKFHVARGCLDKPNHKNCVEPTR